MAAKITRLPREEFRAHGYRTLRAPLFVLKIKKNRFDVARIGVVAGINVHKSAVKRNFWKRQAKAGLAPLVKKGIDALIIVSPLAARTTKGKFQEEIAKAMAKAPIKA